MSLPAHLLERVPEPLSIRLQGIERLPGLDVVRAIAILLVMVHHFRHIPGAPEWLQWFALRGYIGVDLFFVLSGWLIGGQLFREVQRTGTVELRRFWVKRWFRTLPAYYVVLAVLVVSRRISLPELPAMVVFAQNYANPWGWVVTWSLCIEEHFYLALPLVALATLRAPMRAVWVIGGLALLLSPALRWASFGEMARGSYGDFVGNFYSPTHLRLDGLVFGVLLAAVRTFRPQTWTRATSRGGVLAVAGTVLVVASTFTPWATGSGVDGLDRMRFFAAVPGFFMVSLGVALMIPWASSAPVRHRWIALPAVFVAEHAYALYLTHEQVIGAVKRLVVRGLPYAVAPVAVAIGAVLVAVALRQLVEKPGLKLRERMLVSRGRVGTSA
ncbi:acyltransferase family protein [Anaeromyxobacter sp. SG26]|uniref:acyltransferase family protein n=1 Tax=Anaeromyxobacter sp. SG26 TaxID=2925407 RepID=UPI001F5694C0|nr:acyltransferase [Anaeromyxobacter sp. SG26]